jgi:hypothetical protein
MLLAGQVEYRHWFTERFGAVAFGGVGAVAPQVHEFNVNELLPSIGAGLRYTIAEENNVNLRLDFAYGRDDYAIYFGVGEAY